MLRRSFSTIWMSSRTLRKPIAGSVLPPPEKPSEGRPSRRSWTVPPTSVATVNSWRNLANVRTCVQQVPLGLGQRFERDGPAAAAEEGLDDRQRQERLDARLERVLADEVEDDLVGEPGEDRAPLSNSLPTPGHGAEVQGRAGGRWRGSGS